jgi:hypothetical protein
MYLPEDSLLGYMQSLVYKANLVSCSRFLILYKILQILGWYYTSLPGFN